MSSSPPSSRGPRFVSSLHDRVLTLGASLRDRTGRVTARARDRSAPLAAAARHRLAGWTLRGRLLTGILALIAIVCLAIGALSTVAVHGFLLQQLDEQVKATSQRLLQPHR